MGRLSSATLGVALAVLGLLVNPAASVSWVLSQGNAITISRMDPIVNPGTVATHLHSVIGGSKFNQNPSSPAELLSAKCSSVNVQADKSNYWVPQLLYRYPDNTMSPMLGSARIYYHNTAPDVVAFPPGMKILSGLSMARNASDLKAFGLLFSCNHILTKEKALPNKNTHPGGCSQVMAATYFPSCGRANGATDSPDHFSHLTWPHHFVGSVPTIHPTGAHCPESHPIHYPAIFIEHIYRFTPDQPWRNEDNLLVLANGDTTGLSYHADFQNGWDQNVLSRAIKECINIGENLASCAAFKPSLSMEKADQCRLEGEIPAEEVGMYKSLAKLPGCNPLWTANMPNTKPTCAETPAKPAFAAPNSYFQSLWPAKMNIPLALAAADDSKLTDWYRPNVYQLSKPKVGGDSRIIKWGTEQTAKYVKVSSLKDILAKLAGGGGTTGGLGTKPAPAPVPTAAAPPTSPVNSEKDEPDKVDVVVGGGTAPTPTPSAAQPTITVTAPAVTVTVVDKACGASRKRLVARKAERGLDGAVRSHLRRRSRRQAIQG